MRETMFFLASLAGAAVMTAVAVLLQPDSPVWKWILWSSITVFVACAVVLLADLTRPEGSKSFLFGMGVGVAVLLICGIAFYFGPIKTKTAEATLSASEIAAKNKQDRIRTARRWISLSNEILADIPMAKPQPSMPLFDKDMPPDLRSRLWQQENQRMLQAFQDGLNRMSQRYLGRVAEAKIEMQSMNIPLTDHLLDSPMINAFSWEAWATKLGGEGRRILTETGEQE